MVKRTRNQGLHPELAESARSLAYRMLAPSPCSICGVKRTQAHHSDYSMPLNVKWLCKRHHDEIHYPVAERIKLVDHIAIPKTLHLEIKLAALHRDSTMADLVQEAWTALKLSRKVKSNGA